MPKLFDKDLGWAQLSVWRIDESVDELSRLARTTPPQYIKSEARLRSHLAWRALLAAVMPDATPIYNKVGAPCIDAAYISVSHTNDLAALLISAQPCGVDIESVSRNFSRAASRFISAEERSLAVSEGVAWCTKEAIYKLLGQKEVDFLRDMHITTFDSSANHLTATALGKSVEGEIFETEGHIIVTARHTAK